MNQYQHQYQYRQSMKARRGFYDVPPPYRADLITARTLDAGRITAGVIDGSAYGRAYRDHASADMALAVVDHARAERERRERGIRTAQRVMACAYAGAVACLVATIVVMLYV